MKRRHLRLVSLALMACLFSTLSFAQDLKKNSERLRKMEAGDAVVKLPPEFEGVVFDDFYGSNFFPQPDKTLNEPIFYAFYLDNFSKTAINSVEFEYWFDNDRSTLRHKIRNDLQLSPGQKMRDGVGFITFQTPEDMQPHLIYIKPSKLNGVDVDLKTYVRPFRKYCIDKTYRRPTHVVETFIDPTDKEAFKLYRGLVTSVSMLKYRTRQPNRYEFITFVGKAGEKKFTAASGENELAAKYKIGAMPRVMVDRNLMTPYGSLNNHEELRNLSIYTPAMRISDVQTDIYDFLLSRSFYGPGFAQMTPSVSQVSDGKFVCKIKGTISSIQNTKGLRMNVYLVENTPIPEPDENESVKIPEGTVYNKFIKMISPVEGYELKVNEDNTYSFESDAFTIDHFQADKYRVVASVVDPCDGQLQLSSVLQSCGIAVTNERAGEVSMTTVQTKGEMSFALAASQPNTPVSIDWGDGKDVNYTVGTDFSEFKSEVKGPDLKIKGNITKLNCMANKLKALDITRCPQLEVLQAAHNYLSKIDFSQSTEIQNIEIFGSNSLQEINLTNCTKLIRLVASQNFLKELDLSKCPNLSYIDCSRMKQLSKLDLANCHKVRNVIANECALESLVIPVDAPLTELLCKNNRLSSLDLSPYKALENLDCSGNPIKTLKVESPVLHTLYAMATKISSIDLAKSVSLKYLALKDNVNLASLNLDKNTELEELGFSNCKIETLNFLPLSKLTKLWCSNSLLTGANLSHCDNLKFIVADKCKMKTLTLPANNDVLEKVLVPDNELENVTFDNLSALKLVNLRNNHLTSVVLRGTKRVEQLAMSGNKLHRVDIKDCLNLKIIGFANNGMTASELNDMYKQLPKLSKLPNKPNLLNGTPSDEAALTSDTSLALERNWKPKVMGDGSGCINGINETSAGCEFEVSAFNHHLRVRSPFAASWVSLYSLDGKLIMQHHIEGTEAAFSVRLSGTYIVRCTDDEGGKMLTAKVVF